jgi:Fe-S-cluster-containing dehydrogenase component
MSAKWNMIVDVAGCDNCRVCFLAVKDEHTGNDFPGYAASQPAQGHKWLDIRRKERGSYPLVEAHFMPVMCNHCDDAPCMKAAQNGAISKRADGIVIIDPEKSKGQRQIVDACPYGAISWNEEKQIPQAWIFDAHLLDSGWTKTRAEQCCPSGVFRSVKVDDAEMQRIKAAEGLEVLEPELNTRPRVYYKNLHLMTKCFVGGTVVADARAVGTASVTIVEECVAGAEVVLRQNGREVGRATSDSFGEWKIDRLEPGSRGYQLEVTAPAGSFAMQFDLAEESRYLGVMKLTASSR